MVVENLREVEKRVCEACRRAGRDRDEVTLIAVSKTKPASMVREAMVSRHRASSSPNGQHDFQLCVSQPFHSLLLLCLCYTAV